MRRRRSSPSRGDTSEDRSACFRDVYLLASLGPLLSRLGQNGGLITQVPFRLTSQSSFLLGKGNWRVDDVFVDPGVSGW